MADGCVERVLVTGRRVGVVDGREDREVEPVLAVGVNCTPPQYVGSLIGSIAAAAPGTAILAYPNSGERYEASDGTWSGVVTEIDFAAAAIDWLEAGATLVGGCCRVGPTHIATIAESRQSTKLS